MLTVVLWIINAIVYTVVHAINLDHKLSYCLVSRLRPVFSFFFSYSSYLTMLKRTVPDERQMSLPMFFGEQKNYLQRLKKICGADLEPP